MSERFDFTGDDLGPAYSAAVDAVLAGDLVVMPTDTVYGVGADAFKPEAVQRLLDAKGRGRDMPPPVLISVVETMDALATSVSTNGRALCDAFWPGALTVICRAQSSLMWDLGDTYGTVALRVPAHENTRELLSRTGPLAVSSANKSGEPAATDVYDAERQLTDSVRVYLDGGATDGGEPSTIVDLTGDVARVVRLGVISLERLREIDPDVLGPDDDEAGAGPDSADPEFVEPKPAGTDAVPAGAESDPAAPQTTETGTADGGTAESGPETVSAETAEPEPEPEPEAVEPESAEPEAVESEPVELESAEPEAVESEAAEPESAEPSVAEMTEPESIESSGAAGPESVEGAEPAEPESVERVEPVEPEVAETPGAAARSEPESAAAGAEVAAERSAAGKRIDDEPAG